MPERDLRKQAPDYAPPVIPLREPALWMDRRWWYGPVASSATALVVFLATVARDVTWGDAGELITASFRGGVAHPSGYPLYCLLGRLLSLVPIGNVALRYNVMSALAATGAVFMTSLLTWQITKRTIPALAAGWVLAFGYVFWYHAHLAEVYSLHALFVTLILYQLVRFHLTNRNRYLYYYALCCGFSFCNHLSTGFLIFPSLVIVLWTRPRIVTEAGLIARLIGLLAAPLVMYLYLPIAAVHTDAIAWGDPTNWTRFKLLVLGRQYHHLFSPGHVLLNLRTHLLQHFYRHWIAPALIISAVGAVYGMIRWRNWTLGLIVGALGYFAYALTYRISDLDAYFLSPDIFLALLAGLGVEATRRFCLWMLEKDFPQTKWAWAAAFTSVLAVAMAGVQVHAGIAGSKVHRKAIEAKVFSDTVLAAAKGRTLVLTRSDGQTFSMWYRKHVADDLTDLTVVDLRMCGMNYNTWYLEHLRRQTPGLAVRRCIHLDFNRSFLLDNNRELFDTFVVVAPHFDKKATQFQTGRNVWRIHATKLRYVKRLTWKGARPTTTTRAAGPTPVARGDFGITRDWKTLARHASEFGRDEWVGLRLHWRERPDTRVLVTWSDLTGEPSYTHVFDLPPPGETLLATLTPRFDRKPGKWRAVVSVLGHEDWEGRFTIRESVTRR